MRYLLFIVVSAGCNDPDGDKSRGLDTAVEDAANGIPNCVITAPETGEESGHGEIIGLNATVSDPDVEADTLTVTWSSDKDGLIGSSTPGTDGLVTLTTESLTADVHTISLQVDDDANSRCIDTIVHTVRALPPQIVSVTLGPDPARVRDTLVCDYEGFHSPMGGADLSTVEWMVNSMALDTTARVLTEGFSGDDIVTCTVTPDDGLATGTAQSDSVTIESVHQYDSTPAWPLCGRITEDPPVGWNETDGW